MLHNECIKYYANILTPFSRLVTPKITEILGFNLGADDYMHKPFSQRLLLESMGGTTLSASESEAALEAIACLLRPVLHQCDPAPSRREKQFQKIIALIDASIQSEHLRPEWLASEMGMSVRSLYRLFADKGLVVAQYIKNRRLDLCAQALQNVHDDEKLAGIGYRWGFSDHSHFSTAFKQRFGVTPGQYRKRCR